MKILVAGWFSFSNGHATAGDLLTKDVVCKWLDEAGYSYDVALAPPFSGGVDIRGVPPTDYFHVVFLCGPFENGKLEAEVQTRFAHCRLLGLNLSMGEPLDEWNPFDFLIERDSSRAANPDFVFLAPGERVPLVGICLVEPHEGAATREAEEAIQRLLCSRPGAAIHIDTRLDSEHPQLRSPSEVESLIASMDLLITTRLHGMVLSLKNGVPVIAIDAIPGGAKIWRQAETVGWTTVFRVDELDDAMLQRAFDYCLTEEARHAAKRSSETAKLKLSGVREQVLSAVAGTAEVECSYRRRMATPITPFNKPSTQDLPAKGSGLGVLLRIARSLISRTAGEGVDQHRAASIKRPRADDGK